MAENKVTYMPNPKKWDAFMRINKFFHDYIEENGGTVSDIKTPPEVVDAVFTVETMTFDISGEVLRDFLIASTGIDEISFDIIDEDTVRATVRVRDMWKAVGADE